MRRAAGHAVAIGRTAPRRHRSPPPGRYAGGSGASRWYSATSRAASPAQPIAGGGGVPPGGAEGGAAGRVAQASTAAAMAAGSALSTSTPQPAARMMPATSVGEGRGDDRQAGLHGVEQLVRQGQAVVLLAGLEQHQGDVGLGEAGHRLGVRQPGQRFDARR